MLKTYLRRFIALPRKVHTWSFGRIRSSMRLSKPSASEAVAALPLGSTQVV